MSTTFYSGPQWEQSSGPIITRDYHFDDLWPIGAHGDCAGGAKDDLEDGLHPVVAIGPNAANGDKTGRPGNLTGVVIACTDDAELAQVNVADKAIVRSYVANNTTYSGTTPITPDASMAIGEQVWVDDSSGLPTGVTLSRSPINEEQEANPLAGYLHYCQDEMQDYLVGGPNRTAVWPKEDDSGDVTYIEYCVMLVNDYGTSDLDVHELG